MSKTSWKDQYKKIVSASKFHNKVRDIFVSDPMLKNFKCYQEVPVSELIDGYPFPSQRFDWYIEELGVVIELHGAQHYSMVNYGNIGWDDAMEDFKGIQRRDRDKKAAVEMADLEYIEISYKLYNKLDAKLLRKLIFERSN